MILSLNRTTILQSILHKKIFITLFTDEAVESTGEMDLPKYPIDVIVKMRGTCKNSVCHIHDNKHHLVL